MRKAFSALLFLVAGFGLSQSTELRPLPIAATGLPQAVTAKRTDQGDLQRAGYTLKDGGGDLKAGDRRERSYTLEGLSGSSATLIDTEYPAYVLGRRNLVFDVTFSVKEGRSPSDVSAITPALVAAAQRALSQNSAVVAGLGYLATAAESGVAPEALQAAVVAYVREYRQPSTPLHEACTGCDSLYGFSDEYYGGHIHTPLNVGTTGWTIAGIRHYLNGDSAFTLKIIARIPRS